MLSHAAEIGKHTRESDRDIAHPSQDCDPCASWLYRLDRKVADVPSGRARCTTVETAEPSRLPIAPHAATRPQ